MGLPLKYDYQILWLLDKQTEKQNKVIPTSRSAKHKRHKKKFFTKHIFKHLPFTDSSAYFCRHATCNPNLNFETLFKINVQLKHKDVSQNLKINRLHIHFLSVLVLCTQCSNESLSRHHRCVARSRAPIVHWQPVWLNWWTQQNDLWPYANENPPYTSPRCTSLFIIRAKCFTYPLNSSNVAGYELIFKNVMVNHIIHILKSKYQWIGECINWQRTGPLLEYAQAHWLIDSDWLVKFLFYIAVDDIAVIYVTAHIDAAARRTKAGPTVGFHVIYIS